MSKKKLYMFNEKYSASHSYVLPYKNILAFKRVVLKT